MLIKAKVLRALGYFSHTTVISRHHSYRQPYTLILSPTAGTVTPSPTSARTTVGTSVSIKKLFGNYPVRQAALKSNRHVEMTQIFKMTVGIGFSCPVSICLRNVSGDTIVRIPNSEGKDEDRVRLERGLNCQLSLWRLFDGRHENVRLSLKTCLSTSTRSYSFICNSVSIIADQDVNGRYLHDHCLVNESSRLISKFSEILNASQEDDEKFRSSVTIVRITSSPQSTLSLINSIDTILSPMDQRHHSSSRITINDILPLESRMISGRGIEYSKLAHKPLPPATIKVSTTNPGVEYTKMVNPPPFRFINQSSLNAYPALHVLKQSP